MRPRCRGAVWALMWVMFGAEVRAQDSRAELARRDLISRAEAARRARNPAEALDSALRAAQIRQTPSLRLMLAQVHAELGHVLEALNQARACGREVEADSGLRNRELVMRGCGEIVRQMEPRVGRLTVRIAPSLPDGATVRVGEELLNAALLGVAVPTLPGEVIVHAEAAGYRAFNQTVTVHAGQSGEIVVRMEPDDMGAASGGQEAAHVGGRVIQPSAGYRRPSGHSGPGVGPWVTIGVGGVTAAAGTVMFVLAEGARQDRNGARDQNSAQEADSNFRTYAYVGDVLMGVGVVGLVSGALWAVLGRERGERQGPSVHQVMVLPAGGGMTINLVGAL